MRSNTALTKKKKRTWKKNLNTLLSQRKEVSTKTFPKLSAGVIVFSLVILLTPVFNAIARALPAFLNQWTEGTVTAIPILLALIYAVTKRCKLCKLLRMLFNREMRCKFRRKKMNSRKEKKRSSFESFLSKLFYLYKGGVQETETHEEVYSSEASSTQFKDWISKLNEALKASLVIVIDDMDRLPARNVQELWAAIHTLFTEVQYGMIKVIVPFDRSHIISAFREENIQGEDSTPKCYGNDFIDKTFDVVYRVAPPILSNWKTYLIERWNEAFGKEPEGLVTQIYDLLADGKTPREIIAFINECVTIRKTCSPEIPDEYIALFAVGKHEIVQDPLRELLELKFCQPLSYQYDNENTRKYLSAIHYQLEPDNALETIYVEQLRRELDKGESTLLQMPITQSLFTSILEHAIAEITHVENATMALTKVKDKKIKPDFWDQLLKKTHGQEIDPQKPHHVELLKHASEKEATKYLPQIVQAAYKLCDEESDEFDVPGFNAPAFYDIMEPLCRETQDIEYLKPLSCIERRRTTPSKFISFVEKAQSAYKDYEITCPSEDLDKYLSELSINGLEDLSAVPYIINDLKLPKYRNALEEKMHRIDATTWKTLEILLIRWTELGVFAERPLLEANITAMMFTQEKMGTTLRQLLICVAIAQKIQDNRVKAELEKEDEDLASGAAKFIHQFIGYDDLLLACEQFGNHPLYRLLVKELMRDETSSQKRKMDICKVLPRYLAIAKSLDLPLATLLDDWENFSYKERITREWIPEIPVEFFADTREFKDHPLVAHCCAMATDDLRKIEKDNWISIFKDENNKQLKLLITIRSDVPNAYEAFKELIQLELVEDIQPIPNGTFDQLVAVFKANKKQWFSVFRTVRDRYNDAGIVISEKQFQRYGSELIEHGDLSEKPAAIRTILPTKLLKQTETLNILLEHCNKLSELLKHAESDYAEEFEAEVQSMLKIDEKIAPLADALGIHKLDAEQLATPKDLSTE